MKTETIEIQGKTFKYKPCSKANLDIMQTQAKDLETRLHEGTLDRWSYYKMMFAFVLDGPVHELDVMHDDFDARMAETVILNFMPPSMQASALLNAFAL